MDQKRTTKASGFTSPTHPLLMVVDDEPTIRDPLQRILEMNGYRVITAPDGETAIDLVSKEKPDVMLLDLMMPGMDGRQVSARVREISDCRIIYFTARRDLTQSPMAKELIKEADALLTKPATTKRILSTIEFALGNHH